MEASEKFEKLFNEFKAATDEEWHNQVSKEFKDLNSLYWKTYEGLTISPIYTQKDFNTLDNKYLYQQNISSDYRKWLLIEEININDEVQANKVALDALKGGADGVQFHINENSNIQTLLENIWVDNCVLVFEGNKHPNNIVGKFLDYYINLGKSPEDLHGWINYDPLKSWLTAGTTEINFVKNITDLFHLSSSFQNFRPLTINTQHFLNCGSNIVQELAFTLSAGVEYIEALKKESISPEEVFNKLIFSFASGTNLFFEIAKLRAFRHLWAKIAESYDVYLIPSSIVIHSKSSTWFKSALDEENNIIRSGAEALASVLGGCNYLTINSFSSSNKLNNQTLRRISRNISHILKEEAYVNKISDPGAGSFYIESLTDQLVEKSWALFCDLEKKGGFVESAKAGTLYAQLNEIKEQKINNIDLRKDLMIGTNIYSNLNESLPLISNEPKDLLGILKESRAAEGIEELRGWVEHSLKKEGRARPKAYVVNFKDENLSKDKAIFIKNIFSSIGIQVEFRKNLENWYINKFHEEKSEVDLIVAFIDAEAFPPGKYDLFETLLKSHPIILSSPKRFTLDIGLSDHYAPLEALALHQNLQRLLSNIKYYKNEQA